MPSITERAGDSAQLTNRQINRCEYRLHAHVPEALALGYIQQQMDDLSNLASGSDLRDDFSEPFSDQEKIALRFSEQMTLSKPIDDTLWSDLRVHFSESRWSSSPLRLAFITFSIASAMCSS